MYVTGNHGANEGLENSPFGTATLWPLCLFNLTNTSWNTA